MGDGSEAFQEFIRPNLSRLVAQTSCTNDLLVDLYSGGIIDRAEKDDILAQTTPGQKNDKLWSLLMKRPMHLDKIICILDKRSESGPADILRQFRSPGDSAAGATAGPSRNGAMSNSPQAAQENSTGLQKTEPQVDAQARRVRENFTHTGNHLDYAANRNGQRVLGGEYGNAVITGNHNSYATTDGQAGGSALGGDYRNLTTQGNSSSIAGATLEEARAAMDFFGMNN